MIPANKEYPVFEANQVLTATHLNALENYLDEQNRLTRAVLHGIGVVCGLEVSQTGGASATLTISKGYGITSEGYPGIVGNQDFVADRYQEFTVNDGYPLLWANQKNKYPLLELLDAKHDDYGNGKALTSTILDGKIALLFVELLEKDLKNCSATSCDDMGLKVQVNIRKLLISESDLKTLNEEIAKNTKLEQANGDFFPDLTARLGLPDIYFPRVDVPASNMVDGPSIFDAYRAVLSPLADIVSPKTKSLFAILGDTLDKCYEAFKPMLPVHNWTFAIRLASIEKIYTSQLSDTNLIFSQYFYDFLGDLIEAYNEFRWKALEFMALCNPPQTLFPRHLELGETGIGNFAGQKVHRHYFRPSPALSKGKKSAEELQQLFSRLALLVEQFKAPTMPGAIDNKTAIDASVKITPTRLGDVVLSDKAIPFYYTLSPALLGAWNFTKTSTGRAAQNLGYNVSGSENALLSDLERYNFFRIEGHLGFDWRNVVKNLLDKIRKYRLPFDVVALNAHPATATAEVLADPLIAHCPTNDLEIIYSAWTKELECLMGDNIKRLTDFRFRAANTAITRAAPSVIIDPDKVVRKVNVGNAIVTEEGTFGKLFTDAIKASSGDSVLKMKERFKTSLLQEEPETGQLSMIDYDLAIVQRLDTVAAMMDFSNALPDTASNLEYTVIEKKYASLIDTIEKYRGALSNYTPPEENPVLTAAQKEAILNALEAVQKNCLMARLKELSNELENRKKEVDELIFFSKYLQKHPAIAHKAGVSAGGTFVLIFQETPTHVIETQSKKAGAYTIPERVVIADFFLPYRCCSDCPPLQFVMPPARPIFTMKQECPNKDNTSAFVNLDFTYRVAHCVVKIDNKDYEPLVDDRINLDIGPHQVTVMDAAGGVSLTQFIEVQARFAVEAGEPVFDIERKTSTVQLSISNAQLPITLDGDPVMEITQLESFYTVTVSYEQSKTIMVGDASPCPATAVKLCMPVLFAMEQECPDENGFAWVALTFIRSTPPCMVKIDENEYAPLVDNRISLVVGTHEVTVQDADGCVSHPQSIAVRQRFSVEASEPTLCTGPKPYMVFLSISNAQPPIKIDGSEVYGFNQENSNIVTVTYYYDSQKTITISDDSPCTAQVTLFMPVIFTTQQKCPDSEDHAEVIFNFSSGEGPFSIKINDGDFVSLDQNKITLQIGTYQIIVKDNNACVSQPQLIEVRPRFTVQAENPVCDEANKTYTVKLWINNPLLPITIDGKEVDATAESANAPLYSVIVGPFKSGETVTVEVGDSSDCPGEKLTFSHNCCNLPCEGIALRRGYQFLLPVLQPNQNPKLVINKLEFWFEYPKGNRISLSNELQEIILNGGDVAKKINELIDSQTKYAGWLKFYEDVSPVSDTAFEVKTWWIEYFECLELKFGISLEWTYTTFAATMVIDYPLYAIEVTPDDSTVQVSKKKAILTDVKIPAFDGFLIDKCHPDKPEERLCEKPNLTIVPAVKVDGNTVTMMSDTGGSDKATAFLWEVPGSVEKMANGEKALFTFNTIESKHSFRLTAFTERGCRVIKDGTFSFK